MRVPYIFFIRYVRTHSTVQFGMAFFLFPCGAFHVVDICHDSATLDTLCCPLLPALTTEARRSNSYWILNVTKMLSSRQGWTLVADWLSCVNKKRRCCPTTQTHPCCCFLPTSSALCSWCNTRHRGEQCQWKMGGSAAGYAVSGTKKHDGPPADATFA